MADAGGQTSAVLTEHLLLGTVDDDDVLHIGDELVQVGGEVGVDRGRSHRDHVRQREGRAHAATPAAPGVGELLDTGALEAAPIPAASGQSIDEHRSALPGGATVYTPPGTGTEAAHVRPDVAQRPCGQGCTSSGA